MGLEKRALRALCALVLAISLAAIAPQAGRAAPPKPPSASGACVFDHAMLHTAAGSCRPRARHYPPNVTGKIDRVIYDSAMLFGIPYRILLDIAVCESSLNPRAAYRGHYGLYQFLPETFFRAARQLQLATGVKARTFWSPLDASYAAGYMFATGESRSWTCEKLAISRPIG